MLKTPDFILFDDDPVNNTLCQIAIKNALSGPRIKTFTVPEKGFQYISTEHNNNQNGYTIIFLDINMGNMTCWEFLERFDRLEEKVKCKYKIFILSASLSHDDKNRAAENKNVIAFIEKPLTKEKINKIISGN